MKHYPSVRPLRKLETKHNQPLKSDASINHLDGDVHYSATKDSKLSFSLCPPMFSSVTKQRITDEKEKRKKKKMLTILRSDLEATGNDLREAFNWIRAQTRRVQTKTMNIVLTANPITVITKLTPPDIILSH